jgi:glutamine amidotransferase
MNVTIVDYNSGNISSVINSFKEVAKDKVNIEVTADLATIKTSDKDPLKAVLMVSIVLTA